MTDLLQKMADVAQVAIADRDGIHPAHAANRIAVAIKLSDALESDAFADYAACWFEDSATMAGAMTERAWAYAEYLANVARTTSAATRRLALEITEA